MAADKWAAALRRINKDVAWLRERKAADGSDLFPVFREDGAEGEVDPKSWCTLVYGPPDTPYAGGVWRVRFTFTSDFPHKNPSIGFVDHVLHPNVEWEHGSVCLDALTGDEWSPVTRCVSVVEMLLPGLLANPNPEHPLNADAARRMTGRPKQWAVDAKAAAVAHAWRHADRPAGGGSGGKAAGGAGATGTEAGRGEAMEVD